METREYKVMYEVEDTHFWYKGMRDITKSLLDKYLPKNKKIKILDAGCGTGRNIIFLNKYGNVFGFDISSEAIKYCRLRGLKNIKRASIDKIPYKSNSFDLVTCFDVLGQIEVKNIKNAINEFRRVLKPGGILLVRIAAYDWLRGSHDIAVHTKHRFERSELKNIMTKSKFKTVKATYANSWLFPLIILKRLFIRSIHSDVKKVNPLANIVFQIPFIIESYLLKYFDLPFGLSLITIVKK